MQRIEAMNVGLLWNHFFNFPFFGLDFWEDTYSKSSASIILETSWPVSHSLVLRFIAELRFGIACEHDIDFVYVHCVSIFRDKILLFQKNLVKISHFSYLECQRGFCDVYIFLEPLSWWQSGQVTFFIFTLISFCWFGKSIEMSLCALTWSDTLIINLDTININRLPVTLLGKVR